MFLFGKRKEIFGCSFSLMIFGMTFIQWQTVVAAQHASRQHISPLLAAGLLAALLRNSRGGGGGGGGGGRSGGLFNGLQARFNGLQGKPNNQQAQGTVLVPIPVPPPLPPHHHHHHAMHQVARHPIMVSPSHPAPLFINRPIVPMPIAWHPNPMHELAALNSMHQLQQMVPQFVSYSGDGSTLAGHMSANILDFSHLEQVGQQLFQQEQEKKTKQQQQEQEQQKKQQQQQQQQQQYQQQQQQYQQQQKQYQQQQQQYQQQYQQPQQQFKQQSQQMPYISKVESGNQPLVDIREIHPSSPLATTIETLIRQLES